ncbi:MAG TPA: GTP cyclohydrolase I, partial [Myxococcota bacterium]
DIADALVEHGHARGAAVVVECEQLCLLLGENRRGDERVLTTAYAGVYADDVAARAEILRTLELPRTV